MHSFPRHPARLVITKYVAPRTIWERPGRQPANPPDGCSTDMPRLVANQQSFLSSWPIFESHIIRLQKICRELACSLTTFSGVKCQKNRSRDVDHAALPTSHAPSRRQSSTACRKFPGIVCIIHKSAPPIVFVSHPSWEDDVGIVFSLGSNE
ncbi:hypothetical protein L228DRAFT_242865 [Xylona heveae TC161]|uniref:Uncharacterized protein n=1 Tax=Xylona heveae (strain CBS 132557 / TC161) TaxID=1328760 RepID=A0A165JLU2_XYLHT|nr:hypothetical protein L228DRAFT_242865 [Xylona heveae TC161]KZF26402.1 hypothetical protein L228DRAFT_242865 [Xylona heveae TC161]